MNRILPFILLTIITGCVRAPSGIIDRFGTFASPDQRFALVISKKEKSIVAFTVSSANNGRILYSDRIGSDAQRWCFYWDEQGRLWAYSSDTGYFRVITFRPDGTVSKSEVDKNTQIPKPVYEFLPSSMKRNWSI
ncbi:MAG: hypothetical protein JXB10_07980 [Pirellulales bacterium]|nr:hypothetical protein [Pirellulales bacterium]